MSSIKDMNPCFIFFNLVLHFEDALFQNAATMQKKKENGEAVVLRLFHRTCRDAVLHIPFSNCPLSAMRCLRHSQLQFVFIGSRRQTWVITWERMCGCVDECLEVTLPKIEASHPVTHL